MTKTLCLNMIVKNESNNIIRTLDSVIDLIDTFCIVDTGSTDDTVNTIMNYFQGKQIEGKLGFCQFIDFEKTRNYAMKLAKDMSDYLLLMDADMVLEHSIDKNNLEKDYYSIFQDNGKIRYHNTRLVKNNGSFYYRGVTHEVILNKDSVSGEIFPETTAKIIDHEDGGCKSDKLERDKKLLLQNLEDPETQTRYYFYLANTLSALGEIDQAIGYYKERIKRGGWKQEIWFSCYKLGQIYYLKKDFERAMFYFLEAYEYEPDRVENLYYLTSFYKGIGKENISTIYLHLALDIIEMKNFKELDLFLEKKFYRDDFWYKFILDE